MDWRLIQNELKSKCLKQGHGLAFSAKLMKIQMLKTRPWTDV
jgi:hypothetical protein